MVQPSNLVTPPLLIDSLATKCTFWLNSNITLTENSTSHFYCASK